MARPPRGRDERAINGRMSWGVVEIGVVMAEDLQTARTAAFTVMVLAQLLNCLNARSETTSALHHLFVNGWLWGAIALSVALQVAVVHLPVLNVAFGTVPLTASQWAFCAAAACGVLVFGELRKLVLRSSRH